MMIEAITFYLFSGIAVVAGVMVISARNPVHSVLFLILSFFTSAALFVLMGAEFLAMILVIVYVGAVAVLFLFVVMMLNINFTELRYGLLQYLPIGSLVGLILFVELIFIFGTWAFTPDVEGLLVRDSSTLGHISNTHSLGQIIYTKYIYLFQTAGIILLVAMIGAIVLTLRQRDGVRRQNIKKQIQRRSDRSIEIIKVPSGKGT